MTWRVGQAAQLRLLRQSMTCTCLLAGFLLVAAVTDVRRGYVYNWNTYSGIILALVASAIVTMLGVDLDHGTKADAARFGFTSISDSALGLLASGGIMIVCFILFGEDKVGGGDVKLIAMIGAFLGVHKGLEALLWTFVLGAVLALLHLIWKYGVWRILTHVLNYLLYFIRVGPYAKLSKKEREPMAARLWLAPSALAAVLIVRFDLIEFF